MNIDEGRHDQNIFKAVFMVGIPGAGKTTVSDRIKGGTGLRSVNPDELYEYFKMIGRDVDMHNIYQKTHKKLDLYLDGRLGLIIDRTGNNTDDVSSLKRKLEATGYECAMVFVYVDPATAKARTIKRAQEKNRTVDSDYFDHSVKTIFAKVNHYKQMFGGNFIGIENSDNANYSVLDRRMRNFLRAPVENDSARNWKAEPKSQMAIAENVQEGFKIYVDMDGVLCDFDTQFKNTKGSQGKLFHHHGDVRGWAIVNSGGSKWWSSMPWMKDGKKLWSFVSSLGYPVEILSSPSDRTDSRTGKLEWVKNNLGADIKVNFSKTKHEFAKSKKDILIDDLTKHISNWNRVGTGILYKNFEDTKNKLELITGRS
jgi:predicted ABC-type ATPase